MRNDMLSDREDPTTTGTAGHDDPGSGAATASAPARRGPGWLLPWLVAALALAAALYSTIQWRALQAAENERNDVLVAATEFVTTLTTWDAVDGLDDTRSRLRAAGTGAFLDEVDQLFGGTLGDALKAAGASSEGRIQDVFVQDVDGDEATVFAVVVQEVTTVEPEGEDRSLRSARLSLERVDGAWLVSKVELINEEVGDLTAGAPDGSGEGAAASETADGDAPAQAPEGQAPEGQAPEDQAPEDQAPDRPASDGRAPGDDAQQEGTP